MDYCYESRLRQAILDSGRLVRIDCRMANLKTRPTNWAQVPDIVPSDVTQLVAEGVGVGIAMGVGVSVGWLSMLRMWVWISELSESRRNSTLPGPSEQPAK